MGRGLDAIATELRSVNLHDCPPTESTEPTTCRLASLVCRLDPESTHSGSRLLTRQYLFAFNYRREDLKPATAALLSLAKPWHELEHNFNVAYKVAGVTDEGKLVSHKYSPFIQPFVHPDSKMTNRAPSLACVD